MGLDRISRDLSEEIHLHSRYRFRIDLQDAPPGRSWASDRPGSLSCGAARAVGHVQSLLEPHRDRTECVGSVKKLAQDAREPIALFWCLGGCDGLVDAQVAARVHGGEASLQA